MNVQVFFQSPGKFLFVIWNLDAKSYTKFVTLRSFFQNSQKRKKKLKKIKMDSKKSINSFEKKDRSPDYV